MFGKKSKKPETKQDTVTEQNKEQNKKQDKKRIMPDTSTFKKPTYHVTETGIVRHESGLLLEKGDVIMCDFKISSPDGDGWLVITRYRAYVTIKNKGVQLHADWPQVNDFKIKGNNITIIWHEQYVNRYDYTIKILDNKIAEVEKMFLVHARLNEARYVPILAEERDMIRRGRTEEQRNKVRALEDEMTELYKKLAVLTGEFEPKHMTDIVDVPGPEHLIKQEDNITVELKDEINPCHHTSDGSWLQVRSAYVAEGKSILERIDEIEKIMERERANLYFTAFDTIQRSPLIPAEIENKDVWYDAYYDIKHDAYVFVRDVIPTTTDEQKLRDEMNMPYGCGFTPVPANRTKTIFGQPAIIHRSKSIKLLGTAFICMPQIGIENYHYMRFMGEQRPRLHGEYYYYFFTNSEWNGLQPKEAIRLFMRIGRMARWTQDVNTELDAEILEEEIHLAKEGNVNYMSLALEDTPYSDSEEISHIPQFYTTPGDIGYETILFER